MVIKRNFIIRLLKLHKGFSLIEVLISAGIMGAVSLAGMHLISNQEKGLRNIEQTRGRASIIGILSHELSDVETCMANFGHLDYGTSSVNQIWNKEFYLTDFGTSDDIVSFRGPLSTQYSLLEILKNQTGSGVKWLSFDGISFGGSNPLNDWIEIGVSGGQQWYLVYLKIPFKKEGRGGLTNHMINKKIAILVKWDKKDNRIVYCRSMTGADSSGPWRYLTTSKDMAIFYGDGRVIVANPSSVLAEKSTATLEVQGGIKIGSAYSADLPGVIKFTPNPAPPALPIHTELTVYKNGTKDTEDYLPPVNMIIAVSVTDNCPLGWSSANGRIPPGHAIVGAGGIYGVNGDNGGREIVTTTVPFHTHDTIDPGHFHIYDRITDGKRAPLPCMPPPSLCSKPAESKDSFDVTIMTMTDIQINNKGASAPVDIRQPFHVVNYCFKDSD